MVPYWWVEAGGSVGHDGMVLTFLWIALILIFAKMSGLIERLGQPSVLGELMVGVLLGNLALLGVNVFEPIKTDIYIMFMAELGVVILLFQIGLESNVKEMTRVGLTAFLVAIAGVVVPFLLGAYLIGPFLLPGLDTNTYLFLGATLTATSVGVTARVFKDMGFLHSKESQIVLGAAVIDDILGLIILAVVTAIVLVGGITLTEVTFIFFKAVFFLGSAIILGKILAPYIGNVFSFISRGVGMKFALAFSVGLVFAYLAHLMGMAPIIGAFAGGLILDDVTFKRFRKPEFCDELEDIKNHTSQKTKIEVEKVIDHYEHKHVEDLLQPVGQLFVPVFFVFTGMSVDLTTFADTAIILTAIGLTLVAIFGKLVSGFVAGKGYNKWVIGFGMVPRGEVGLIFATIGLGLGVVTDGVFSVIIMMVIITTLVTPPVLAFLFRHSKVS